MFSINRFTLTLYMILLRASRRAIAPTAFSSSTAQNIRSSPLALSRFSSLPLSVSETKNNRGYPTRKNGVAASRQFTSFPSSTTSLPVSLTGNTDTVTNNQTNAFSTMADATTYPTEMTEAERYLFDLNGFLIIRNVLTPNEVAACHAAIDGNMDTAIARSDATLRNAIEGSPMYGSGPPRLDLGGIFEWGEIESRVFKKILAHPRLVPLFHGLLGKGYRLDHIPFVLMNNMGGEGFQLHGGTVDCTSGEYNSNLAYTCHNGNVRSNLLGCNVMLVDHNPGDGGKCKCKSMVCTSYA